MKKYLFIILAAALFLGCSKKESTAPPSYIIGKWNIIADTAREAVNGTITSTTVLKESISPYITFNANGSGVIMRDTTGAGATLKFNYFASESVITFNYPAQTYNGAQEPAVQNSCTLYDSTSGTIELVFAASEQNAGTTITNFETIHIHK